MSRKDRRGTAVKTVFGQIARYGKEVNRYRLLIADNCRRQRPKPPVTYDKSQVMPRASAHSCVASPIDVGIVESNHARQFSSLFQRDDFSTIFAKTARATFPCAKQDSFVSLDSDFHR